MGAKLCLNVGCVDVQKGLRKERGLRVCIKGVLMMIPKIAWALSDWNPHTRA